MQEEPLSKLEIISIAFGVLFGLSIPFFLLYGLLGVLFWDSCGESGVRGCSPTSYWPIVIVVCFILPFILLAVPAILGRIPSLKSEKPKSDGYRYFLFGFLASIFVSMLLNMMIFPLLQ